MVRNKKGSKETKKVMEEWRMIDQQVPVFGSSRRWWTERVRITNATQWALDDDVCLFLMRWWWRCSLRQRAHNTALPDLMATKGTGTEQSASRLHTILWRRYKQGGGEGRVACCRRRNWSAPCRTTGKGFGSGLAMARLGRNGPGTHVRNN